ncbi:glycosyltransferase family 31 protein [Dothidotthia symphoricarpi CBS 119687]|uniref:Glycosyltransferase family 31 protein n=1 Tax=Dothidotthia symphoricarpi CBS 119687 TaxID=1392245 RepID=A0A6A5ZVH3_9PLEO|nr:glycosyltransferase family 31 protein [Dothidotthia symphoricarpi CBS 119687]KAF2123519.1 glycosyltransferase family 31 protein [Dothidotthia symphoricarpi CBS 119687]
MPLLTPSRIAVVVLCLSLISFLWTYGLPHQLAQPSLPIVGGLDDGAGKTSRLWHAVAPTATVGGQLGKEKEKEKETSLPPPPVKTGSAGHDEDGGRWVDGDGKTRVQATTLVTEILSATEMLSANASMPTAATGPTLCQDVPNAPHVMIILKTSKAELHKLPPHLRNLLSCAPNSVIFSDHTGDIDGHIIHDALAPVSGDAKRQHDEFREYQLLRTDAHYKPDAKKTKDLDKWKTLPMVYQAYQMNPHAKFFVFIEADTSLSWTNLLQWTSRLDYRIPYYAGAPARAGKTQFAQRGAGILLSQGALRSYAKSYEERYISEWESRVGKECCGDIVLATALYDAHVEFYAAWPLLQGEAPHTLDYTRRHWCAPAVSWHHVNSSQLDEVWAFEKRWTETHGWKKPYLYKHAFGEFVLPFVVERKVGWDNLCADARVVAPKGRQVELQGGGAGQDEVKMGNAPTPLPPHSKRDDKKQDDKKPDAKPAKPDPPNWDKIPQSNPTAADSPLACQAACKSVADCVQWRHTSEGDGICFLGRAVKLGKPVEDGGEEKETWVSGWMVERIRELGREWECKEVKWRFYQ